MYWHHEVGSNFGTTQDTCVRIVEHSTALVLLATDLDNLATLAGDLDVHWALVHQGLQLFTFLQNGQHQLRGHHYNV